MYVFVFSNNRTTFAKNKNINLVSTYALKIIYKYYYLKKKNENIS